MCLNPLDPQTMRIFSEDGTFHTIAANSGGGMMRHGVMQTCAMFAKPDGRVAFASVSLPASRSKPACQKARCQCHA